MSNDTTKYREMFLRLAAEHIKILGEAIGKLKENPVDPALLEIVIGETHSLKGEAAGMQHLKTAILADTLHDLFHQVLRGRLELDPPLVNMVSDAYVQLAASIKRIESGERELDLTEISTRLRNKIPMSETLSPPTDSPSSDG